MRQYFMIN